MDKYSNLPLTKYNHWWVLAVAIAGDHRRPNAYLSESTTHIKCAIATGSAKGHSAAIGWLNGFRRSMEAVQDELGPQTESNYSTY
jgi:hypothetical protein